MSLEYSESEQLQFSHPPKESKGPRKQEKIAESPEQNETDSDLIRRQLEA